jgi:hypothetical protein
VRSCIDVYVLLAFVGIQEVQHRALIVAEKEVPIVSDSAECLARSVEPVVDALYWEKERRSFGKSSKDY